MDSTSSSWRNFHLVIGFTAALYLFKLDRVHEIYFDEHYYVTVAYQMNSGVWHDPCWGAEHDDEGLFPRALNFEHPPLAKLLIAGSIYLLDHNHTFAECRDPDGDGKEAYDAFLTDLRENGNPIAWRLPSAIFGVLTVIMTGLAAGRIFGSPRAAAIAAFASVADTLLYTSARTAILDIFPTGLAMVAVYTATFTTTKDQNFLISPPLLCSLFLGLGFACKFTVVLVGPLVLLILWLSQYRKDRNLTIGYMLSSLTCFAVLPNLLLLLSYIPWWRLWIPEMGIRGAVVHWFRLLKSGLTWATSAGRDSVNPHPYNIEPMHWLTLSKPMAYFVSFGGDGIDRYIYGVGNPVVWWGGMLASLVGCVGFLRRLVLAQRRSGTGVDWLPTDAQLVSFSPVMILGAFVLLLHRECYLYYMTMVVPFLALSVTGPIELLFRHEGGFVYNKPIAQASLLLIGNGFLHFLPMAAAWDMTYEELVWRRSFVPWMKI